MNELLVLTSIIFMTIIGFVIIRGFNLLEKDNLLLTIGVSFGLGAGLLSLQLYLFSRLGILWQKELLLIPWLLLVFVTILVRREHFSFHFLKIPKLFFADKLLLAGIGITICYVVFEALLRPVGVWDAWATWLVESKVFFIDGMITQNALKYIPVFYPLLFPLLNTYILLILGTYNDTAVLLLSSAFYVFLGITFFSVLYRKYGFRYALGFTLLLLTTQNLIRHGGRIEAGIADLPLSYYFLSSIALLFEYFNDKRWKTFVLVSIFLGLSGLTKNEGVPFVFIMTCISVFIMYREKLLNHSVLILIPFAFLLDWEIFKRIHALNKLYFSDHHLLISWTKTLKAVVGTIKEFFIITSWNVLWILYFYSLLFMIKKNLEIYILHLVIIFQLCTYLLLYVFTSGNSPESSIARLLVHVAPLACLCIAFVAYENVIPFKIMSFFNYKKYPKKR